MTTASALDARPEKPGDNELPSGQPRPEDRVAGVPRELLTIPQAAGYLGLTSRKMDRMRWEGNGPSFIRMGRVIRYRREDLDRFLEANRFASTAEARHS